MIGSDHQALIDHVDDRRPSRPVGGPLIMIALLLAVWVTARGALWQNPFPIIAPFANAASMMAASSADEVTSPTAIPASSQSLALSIGSEPKVASRSDELFLTSDRGPAPAFAQEDVAMAMAHRALWHAALESDPRSISPRARYWSPEDASADQAAVPVFPGSPPFDVANADPATPAKQDRWSLNVWAFARRAPGGALIAPGPAPVYGASQAGAILQHRLDPSNPRDPRAYLRATRALIDNHESEVAAGVSARPLASIPVRVAGEIRASDNAFGQRLRPALFAISELPPLSLPMNLAAEIYAAGGYVGGETGTAFAEGQATVTRGVTRFDLAPAKDLRLSVGAGAWGGAQRGVHRVDVGPTLRLDMALGAVPARVSIDYRERVEGEATPNSGIAATLSTQF